MCMSAACVQLSARVELASKQFFGNKVDLDGVSLLELNCIVPLGTELSRAKRMCGRCV